MLVYNLLNQPLDFKGRTIPPNGGSVDFPGLAFIPDRDRELEKGRVLAFGSLPYWWLQQQAAKNSSVPVTESVVVKSDKKVVEIKK